MKVHIFNHNWNMDKTCFSQFILIFFLCSITMPSITWILPISPVLSILLATLTVFPQISYWGLLPPTTPATTGPRARPTRRENVWNNIKCLFDGKYSSTWNDSLLIWSNNSINWCANSIKMTAKCCSLEIWKY